MALRIAQAERGARHSGEAVEGPLLRPPAEEGLGRRRAAEQLAPVRALLQDCHETVVFVEREPAQDDGVDHGEDGGAGPDAEGQDDQGDRGEGR